MSVLALLLLQMLGMLADLKRAGTGTVADGDGRNTIE